MAYGTVDYYSSDVQLKDTLTTLTEQTTKQGETVTKLTESVNKLVEIIEAVAARRRTDYAVVTTACKQIISVIGADHFHAVFYAHPDNTDGIRLYDNADCTGNLVKTLAVGELFGLTGISYDMSAKAASGTQYLKFTLG